ncbi:MAG: DKNYY domain-containing protein [Parcubacteria group bacterium]|nr:DKNYY domain-containing protein [Parcubacteria group bacterium]
MVTIVIGIFYLSTSTSTTPTTPTTLTKSSNLSPDPNTLQIVGLGGRIVKDKNWVWFDGERFDSADPITFQVLYTGFRAGYAKDKNKVWSLTTFNGIFFTEIPEADASTFQSLGGGYAQDKSKFWHYGYIQRDPDFMGDFVLKELTNVDPTTFKVLMNGYAQDKNNTYLNGQITKK